MSTITEFPTTPAAVNALQKFDHNIGNLKVDIFRGVTWDEEKDQFYTDSINPRHINGSRPITDIMGTQKPYQRAKPLAEEAAKYLSYNGPDLFEFAPDETQQRVLKHLGDTD